MCKLTLFLSFIFNIVAKPSFAGFVQKGMAAVIESAKIIYVWLKIKNYKIYTISISNLL